jgi:catalase
VENTANNMAGVTQNILERHAAHCYLADAEYGEKLAAALELDLARVKELAALSHDERMKATSLAQ